ncbi:MAG: hypothetical protein IJU76_10555, partial [Desulfovibrionaceae bacterium]|nr:hypothetical protein [Desulfovibrionaceae bacterium]
MLAPLEAESVKQISQRNNSEGGIRQGSSVTPRAGRRQIRANGRTPKTSQRAVEQSTTHNEEQKKLIF